MEVIYDLDTEAARTAEKLACRWPAPRLPGADPRSSRCCATWSLERAAAERGEQPARPRRQAAGAGTTADVLPPRPPPDPRAPAKPPRPKEAAELRRADPPADLLKLAVEVAEAAG